MTEQTIRIWPTVLVLDREGGETFGYVTAWEGEGEALIVFRGPEDAFRFQEQVGRYAPEEGYRAIGMELHVLDALLAKEGIGYVAVPERWVGGDGGVDLFEASDFITMLGESREADNRDVR